MRTTRVVSVLAAILLAACGPVGGESDSSNDDGSVDGSDDGGSASLAQVENHPQVECGGESVCTIEKGTIERDLNLVNEGGAKYILGGKVFVGDGESETVLTVEPGVTVFGASGSASEISFLTIRQNSKIVAEGTKEKPIVFTSSAKKGERGRGQWGGLIINGKAPINSGETAKGEGGTGTYGGSDPKDDSGVLKYVRVEYAGELITSENELNGIAFQGVGSGTTIENVQVHMNADDGVEFFGGTANARNLVLTGIGDDSLDWTSGWTGKVQNVVAHQYDDRADRGIEADNLEEAHDKAPRSQPTLSNITIIGSENSSAGILLRRGTGANIYNAIVMNSGKACLDLDSKSTFTNGWSGGSMSGELTIKNSIVWGCAEKFADDEESKTPFSVKEWFSVWDSNKATKPGVGEIGEDPDYSISEGSAADTESVQPEGDSWFDDTEYIGGVGAGSDWTDGWTQQARK